MESLFVPTLIVALAEIGDKTQLLALLLAARFRRPWPIIWGIVAATLANHFAAGALAKPPLESFFERQSRFATNQRAIDDLDLARFDSHRLSADFDELPL